MFFLKLIIYPLSLLPFSILYVVSDVLALVLHRIIRYRRRVIYDNLTHSFPQKNIDEIHAVAAQFYKNMSDTIVEGIKAYTISQQAITKRCVLTNAHILDPFYDSNRHIVGVMGHVYNWEWPALSSGFFLKHQLSAIYKPLKNPGIDQAVKKNRSRFGATLLSMKEVVRFFYQDHTEPYYTAFIFDQSPTKPKAVHWVDFLGRKTAFLPGPAKIAHKYNLPVVFANIKKLKRGYYAIDFEIIEHSPNTLKPIDITEKIVRRLEQQIEENPSAWLWSHKRWKHDYANFTIPENQVK